MASCSGSCPITNNIDDDKSKKIKISVEKSSIVSKVKSGKHSFYSDETEEWGGKSRYPDPWDYILGGLGACITTTLRQYADQHNINLERVEVNLEYKYDLSSSGSPYIVEKQVLLFGDISNEEKERLILVSDSPAQKMLERGLDVRNI